MTPVDRYDEVREVLTSSRFLQASKQESEPFVGGTLLTLDGDDHRRRRRLLVDLVRMDALRAYETDVLAPTLEQALGEVAGRATSRPAYADLVELARTIFLRLAAATIGLEDATSPVRTARLTELLYPLLEGVTVEWATRPHEEVMAEGLAAKQDLDDEFLRPTLSARAGGRADRVDLLGLLLDAGFDPERDHETILRETVLFLAASTLNNASLITHAVEELEGVARGTPRGSRRARRRPAAGGRGAGDPPAARAVPGTGTARHRGSRPDIVRAPGRRGGATGARPRSRQP
jgi:cytochrome P450